MLKKFNAIILIMTVFCFCMYLLLYLVYCCSPAGIGLSTRKIALKLKQRKMIEQVSDKYVIKTLSTLRNYVFSFRVDEEFDELTKGLDERHCKVNHLYCSCN